MLERVLQLANERHGSAIELCKALGVARNTVTEWKAGRSKSYTKYASQIAAYYGVSLDWLSGATDEKAQKNIPTPEGEENDCVSISIPMQKQLYEIYHAAVKQLDITDGFAVTRAGLRANILSWMKNGFCSMSRKRDLLALASVLEIESEILPLVSSLPPLEGGLLEVYRELHDLVDGIPPSKLQTVRDVLAAFSENRA